MRNKLVVGYVIGLHLLLVLVLAKSDFIAKVGKVAGLASGPAVESSEPYRQTLTFHERMDPNVPDGAVIFFGDSIVQGLCVSAVASPSVNFGVGGDTTRGLLKRLPGYRSLRGAGLVVIAAGANDIPKRGDEEILANLSSILGMIPQRVPVVVSAILPVNERRREDFAGRNKRILQLNKGVEAVCTAQGPRCAFMDAGPELIDSTGNLRREFGESDGLHLNGAGNAVLIRQLSSEVAEHRSGGGADAAPTARTGPHVGGGR